MTRTLTMTASFFCYEIIVALIFTSCSRTCIVTVFSWLVAVYHTFFFFIAPRLKALFLICRFIGAPVGTFVVYASRTLIITRAFILHAGN